MACSARVGGAFEGSPDLRFAPGKVSDGEFRFEIGTAGNARPGDGTSGIAAHAAFAHAVLGHSAVLHRRLQRSPRPYPCAPNRGGALALPCHIGANG